MEEGVYYANRFLTAGADGIEVMGGSWKPQPDLDDIPSTADKPGRMLGLCSIVKKTVLSMPGEKGQPVFIGGGRTYLPELAEQALADGQCDFIFMGHGLLAEPHLVNYLEHDCYDQARPCIGCNLCADDQLSMDATSAVPVMQCSAMGIMTIPSGQPLSKKNVLVVGGGISQMRSCRVSAIRMLGHPGGNE